MSVLSQTLLAFVSSHFVLFSFLTTWHNVSWFCTDAAVSTVKQKFILNLSDKNLL